MSEPVELATAYLNPSPQLSAHANRLPDLFSRPAANPDVALAPQSTGKPWALNRRLSEEVRRAIVTAHQECVRQQVLADLRSQSLQDQPLDPRCPLVYSAIDGVATGRWHRGGRGRSHRHGDARADADHADLRPTRDRVTYGVREIQSPAIRHASLRLAPQHGAVAQLR